MYKRNLSKETKAGFTIVELTLTMSFIGVLLITIAIIISNILTIYQKGMALKSVNEVGRELIDNFSDTIKNAPVLNIESSCATINGGDDQVKKCEDDKASMFVYNTYSDAGAIASKRQQYGGVFCTGKYSYVWNTAYGRKTGRGITLEYQLEETNDSSTPWYEQNKETIKAEDLRLVRIRDPERRVCTAAMPYYPDSYDSMSMEDRTNFGFVLDISHEKAHEDRSGDYIIEPPETNLLSSDDDTQLILYELTVFPRSDNLYSGRTFYSGTFILGTLRYTKETSGSETYYTGNIHSSGDFCNTSLLSTSSTAESLSSETNYCALNKFNFAAQTAGE